MPRFRKGKPPGPGRPPGSRNQSALLLDELGSEGTEKAIRVARECVENGNMRAASIMLARPWPHRRHQVDSSRNCLFCVKVTAPSGIQHPGQVHNEARWRRLDCQ